MKILHIADFGRSGNFNGVGSAVINLARNQSEFGVEVKIIHTKPNDYVDKSICKFISNFKEFKRFTSEYNPDITIFHSFYDFRHPIFAKILNQYDIPYIITYHGGSSKGNFKKKRIVKYLANKIIFRSYIQKSVGTIYLNEGEKKNSIFTDLDNIKSYILPNGINKPNNIHKFKSNRRYNFIFFSRLDFHGKGLDILLPSIKSIEDALNDCNVKFYFFGYNYNDGTVEKIKSIGDICEYGGYIVGEDKEKIFLNSDIMILPSRSEGMPISILEGLSYGIPCIVTPETNISDIILNFNCGWITTLNKETLSNVILKAIQQYTEDSEGYIQRSIAAASKFAWQNIAKKSISLYSDILTRYNNEKI